MSQRVYFGIAYTRHGKLLHLSINVPVDRNDEVGSPGAVQ